MIYRKLYYYAFAITTLGDWLQYLAPDFKPMRSQTKPVGSCTCDFFRALMKLVVIARSSDWLIALFAPVVIGRMNLSFIGFSTVV